MSPDFTKWMSIAFVFFIGFFIGALCDSKEWMTHPSAFWQVGFFTGIAVTYGDTPNKK